MKTNIKWAATSLPPSWRLVTERGAARTALVAASAERNAEVKRMMKEGVQVYREKKNEKGKSEERVCAGCECLYRRDRGGLMEMQQPIIMLKPHECPHGAVATAASRL